MYILASKRNGTLYIGVTSNLQERVRQHKSDLNDGFTKRYGVHMAHAKSLDNGGPATQVAGYTDKVALRRLASKSAQADLVCVARDFSRRAGLCRSHDGVHLLAHDELHANMVTAITREKQLKKWNRAWKLNLIEQNNPDWRDLWEDINQ